MKRMLHVMALILVVLGLFAVAGPTTPSLAGGEERVMVEFVPGRGAAVRATLHRAGGTLHHQFDDLNVMAVTLPTAALDGIRRNPNVVLVAPDEPRYLMGQTIPWGIDAVQARDVWDADRNGIIDAGAPTGEGITVCIIDSGLYTAHEDFAGVNVLGGYPTGWNTDGCGHGTHVAGTIAAANNELGVVGVSPGVSLYIVKVFGNDCGWSYSSDLIDATDRCQSAGAGIISMSLGGAKGIGPWEQRKFDALYRDGILSIAAAGNDGNTALSYPASYSSVVSVAAVDSDFVVADFSQQNSQVELAAPGVGVLSTVPWIADTSLTVDGTTYSANHIDYAAYGSPSGALVDGGRCTSTGSWSGRVVLCERGDISFYDKVMNVQNSGGAAAVIYNNEPGGFLGTLGEGYSSTIPAISVSQEDGQYLVANKLGKTGDVVSSIDKPASGYEAWNGTSMATPHVSGVAALLWSSDPNLTNADIRTVMQQTALDLGATGRDNAYGYGLVQAYAAWQYLGGVTPPPPDNQPPVASFTVDCTELSCIFDASASDDPDGNIVSYDWDFGDGTGSSGVTPSRTYAEAGTYTVSLTVTDNEGATDSTSKDVTVSSGGGGDETVIYVFSIEVSGKKAGVNRSATAVVTIGEVGTDALVSGATVYGTWSGEVSGSVSGVTGSNGTVSFESAKVRNTGTFTFTVDNVVKDDATYIVEPKPSASDTVP